MVNFCTNNYPGLSTNPELIQATKASYDNWARPVLRPLYLRHPAVKAFGEVKKEMGL